MFLADYLQNEIKTSFRAFLWKGCGRRRGEQEAARLQQSTDALFCDRQDSGTAGLCCTWATPVQVSVAPKWQQLNVGTRGTGRDQERGAEQSWQLTNFVDKWSRERGIGCIVGHPCLRTGPRSLPAQCSRQGRHRTESVAPGVPSLKSSSKEEMSRFAFSHRSEARRDVPRYIIPCAQVCPRPARRLQELWKHLYPSHLNAHFRQIFLEAFKRHRLIFCHAHMYFFSYESTENRN